MEKRTKRSSLLFQVILVLCIGVVLFLSSTLSWAQSPLPMPGWFKNNVFSRNFVSSAEDQTSDLLERLTKDGKVTISAGDIVAVALQNNLDLKVERQNVPAGNYDILKSRGPFDPIIRASANTDRALTPSRSFLQGGVFGSAAPLDSLTQNFNFAYLQAFETGTSAEIDYNNQKQFSRSRIPSFNPSIFTALRLAFTQPMLRNRGIGVNSTQIKIARNNLNITRHQFELKVINITSQALNLYWEVVFDRADVGVKEQSLKLAMKTNEDNKRQVEIGTMAPIDLVQSETQVASMRQALIVSQYTLQQTQASLKRLLSGSRDPSAIIADLDPVDKPTSPGDDVIPEVKDAINEALQDRPELAQARLDLQNKDLQFNFTRNQLLPQVDINGTVQWVGFAGNSVARDSLGNPIIGSDGQPVILSAGFRDASHQLFNFQFPEYAFGVTMSLPVKNKSAEADFGRASYMKRQSEFNLRLGEQQIALQVRNTRTTVEMNKAVVAAATRTRELQEKTLDAENKKYQLGASTVFFVLQQQTTLAIDQTNEVRAMINYVQSKINLSVSEGRLLKDFNVQIDNVVEGKGPVTGASTTLLSGPSLSAGSNR